MDFIRTLFGKATEPDFNLPHDYFKVQRFYLLFMGVWPEVTLTNVFARNVVIFVQRLGQALIVFVMLHLAVLFGFTFYFERSSSSFARLSFALSQMIIFCFSTFTLVFMMSRSKTMTRMMEQMNKNFKNRSAKGE